MGFRLNQLTLAGGLSGASGLGVARSKPSATAISLHCAQAQDRSEVEAFITAVYRSAFDAEPTVFAPTLVALRDGQYRIIAAAGYRGGAEGAFFLEHYLDQPVEQLMAGSVDGLAVRADFVEVGHLCAVQSGAGRSLALWLAMHLAQGGFRWAVGTLTAELRHLFLRMGIAAQVLNKATPEAMGDDAVRWGRYYDHQPLVLAASLDQVGRVLQSRGGSL